MIELAAISKQLIKFRVIIPMIAIVIGFLIFIGLKFHHKDANSTKSINYVVHLKSGGLSLDSRYKLASDVDKNGKISGGDIVSFVFSLTNDSKQASRYVTIKTGIPKPSLAFLHNYKGTTGVAGNANDIEFKNIVVLPGESQDVSFDATVPISSSEYKIRIQPALVDAGNSLVLNGQQKTVIVAGSSNSSESSATVSATGVKQ